MTTTAGPGPSRHLLDEPLPGEGLVLAAAMGSAMAGSIHLMVVPGHWGTSVPMTIFFVCLGLGQLLLAAGLRWRLPHPVVVGVIMGHLVVMGLYVTSRSIDLPFVPAHDAAHEMEHLPVPRAVGDGIPLHPGSRVEPVGVLDLVCLVAELVLVVSLAALLPPRLRSVVTTMMAGTAVLAILWRAWALT